jgi:NADH-quinone oxidoreductase subunit L
VPRLHRLLSRKYYVDEIYDATAVRGTLGLGHFSHKVVDVFFIDFLLVRGSAWIYQVGGSALRLFQNGDLQRYAAYIVLGLATILFLVFR